MELRHLRYFVAVAETLHFGRAAEQLGVAQPSLSHQIRQLESELRATVLHRTKRRVQLTEAGRLFLEEAREILARADRAAVIARSTSEHQAGSLRIGIAYCMDQSLVLGAVRTLANRDPSIRVEIRTVAVPFQFSALRDVQLDVGFVRPPVNDPALSHEVLLREPFVAALWPEHRLASRGIIELAALAKDAFVLVPRDAVPVYHYLVLRACREAGFAPNAAHEADDLPMILDLVAGAKSVALVPASARSIRRPALRLRTLRSPAPSIETAVAWRRDNSSPLLGEFLQCVRIAASQHRWRSALGK